MASERERFDSKWAENAAGCWIWQRAVNKDTGYGAFRLSAPKRQTVTAHRYAYMAYVGEVPEGLELDHLCRVRECVNPAHLEAVTRQVNQLRGEGQGGRNARKAECPQGHPYEGDNLYVDPSGGRRCNECRRANSRRRAALRR